MLINQMIILILITFKITVIELKTFFNIKKLKLNTYIFY